MKSSPRRSRVCALCLQSYGSGLRDHVAASDVLRARRMLTDRHAAGDPALRRGIDMFLDELTDKRPSDANKQSTRLTVCAFCTQFLPPVYQEDKLVDDLRYQILGNSTPAHGQTTKSVSHPHRPSSLVIQHQLHKPTRPRTSVVSSSRDDGGGTLPPEQQTYRLLTNEITRVLHVDAALAGSRDFASSNSSHLTADAMKNLRHQERSQASIILRTISMDRSSKMQRSTQNYVPREQHFCQSSDLTSPRTEKRNIVQTIYHGEGGAGSLYSGTTTSLQPSVGPRSKLLDASRAQSRIVRSKNGRFIKTELLFPALPR